MSTVTHSRSVLHSCLVTSSAPAPATTTSADFSLRHSRLPFRNKARSPQVRTHTFIAQPPHLRRLALVTRALQSLACSPCLTAPSMRFLFIGSRLTLHASSPRSVTLTQLRFALLTVTSSQRDLHPQMCAHAGRTNKKAGWSPGFGTSHVGLSNAQQPIARWLRIPEFCCLGVQIHH